MVRWRAYNVDVYRRRCVLFIVCRLSHSELSRLSTLVSSWRTGGRMQPVILSVNSFLVRDGNQTISNEKIQTLLHCQ
jgi:hypothetical protein